MAIPRIINDNAIFQTMSTFGESGEREVIDRIRSVFRRPECPDELIDDAAIITHPTRDVVACMDSLSFDRHMPKGTRFDEFGWMCASANLSDLASMGARPSGLLVSFNMPLGMDVGDIVSIANGIDQCAEFAETYVIGGDTKPGDGTVCITALGCMEGRKPMTRKGAREGDVIAVTGSLGGPAAGFHALEKGIPLKDAIDSLRVPIPRVEEGLALSETGLISSCMDLSDGLSTCINTLCRESNVGAIVDWDLIPKHEGVSEIHDRFGIPEKDMVMDWGGEYELLFTFDRNDIDELTETGVEFHMIGLITDDGCLLHRDEKYEEIGYGGY